MELLSSIRSLFPKIMKPSFFIQPILCLYILLLPPPIFANDHFLPEFEGREERREFVERLLSSIPWLDNRFASTYAFGPDDFEELLKDEMARIESYTQVDPEYLEKMEQKKAPLSMKITELETKSEMENTLTKKGALQIRNEITRVYEALLSSETLDENFDLLKLIGAQIQLGVDRLRVDPQGIVTVLRKYLSKDEREILFSKSSQAQQFEYLETLLKIDGHRLTEKPLKISRVRLGLPEDTELDTLNLIRIAKLSISDRYRFLNMLFAYNLLEDGILKEDQLAVELGRGNQVVLSEFINSLKPKALRENSLLLNAKESSPSFYGLEKEQWLELFKQIKKFLKDFRKTPDLFKEESVEKMVEKHQFFAFDVPPYLGVLRSCIADDCSSSISYGTRYVPYVPSEHVFFIMDGATEIPLAYSTIQRQVISEGPRAGTRVLYIKDLVHNSNANQGLSMAAIEAFLYSLRQLAPHYDATEVVFPSAIAEGNSNQGFLTRIEELLNEELGPPETVKMEVLDKELREFIRDKTRNYESPKSHETSELFVPSPEKQKLFKAKIIENDRLDMEAESSIEETGESEVLSALRRLQINSEDQLDGLSLPDKNAVIALSRLLENPEQISLDEYYQSVSEEFLKLDIITSGRFFKKNRILFSKGHLVASDAFASVDNDDSKQTIRHLISILKGAQPSSWLSPIIRNNFSEIEEHPRMNQYFDSAEEFRDNRLVQFRMLVLTFFGFEKAKEFVSKYSHEEFDLILYELLTNEELRDSTFVSDSFFGHLTDAIQDLSKVSSTQLVDVIVGAFDFLGEGFPTENFPRLSAWISEREGELLDSLSAEDALQFAHERRAYLEKKQAAARIGPADSSFHNQEAKGALPHEVTEEGEPNIIVLSEIGEDERDDLRKENLVSLSEEPELLLSIPALHALYIEYGIETHEKHVPNLVQALDNGEEDVLSDTDLHITEMALDLLLQKKWDNSDIVDDLLKTALEEDDGLLRGKGALAYFWNHDLGTNPEEDPVLIEIANEIQNELNQVGLNSYSELELEDESDPAPPIPYPSLRNSLLKTLVWISQGQSFDGIQAEENPRPPRLQDLLNQIGREKHQGQGEICILDDI